MIDINYRSETNFSTAPVAKEYEGGVNFPEWFSSFCYFFPKLIIKMEDLKLELDKFFRWAYLTKEEYLKGIKPKNPEINLNPEWESDYLGFKDLDKVFLMNIKNKDNFSTYEFYELLFLAISIDNESGHLANLLVENADGDLIEEIYLKCLESNYEEAKFALLLCILKSKIKDKLKIIDCYLKMSNNTYIKEKAKYLYDNFKISEK